MAYADEEKKEAYYKNYWNNPVNKERNRMNQRLRYAKDKPQLVKYWRKKYMFQFNCSEEDCKHLSIEQMKEEIKTGLCSV